MQIGVRFSPAMLDALDEAAAERGAERSEIVRQIVGRWMRKGKVPLGTALADLLRLSPAEARALEADVHRRGSTIVAELRSMLCSLLEQDGLLTSRVTVSYEATRKARR